MTYSATKLDFGAEWPIIVYRDAVREGTGIDLHAVRDVDELKAAIRGIGLIGEDYDERVSYAALVDLLYKRTVRPQLVQPCFLVHHPAGLVPLARRSDDDGTRLDMFQVVVNGWEVVKAYSELIDPVAQRHRFTAQAALAAAGDPEAMVLDEDFLEALEYGMPPTGGMGMGMDRLMMTLTGLGIRETILFPLVRPISH